MRIVIALVELALALWVAFDARNLGARRGQLGGGLLDMGPVAWFFSCFLCFLVGFVCYLVTRPRLIGVLDAERRAAAQASQFNRLAADQPRSATIRAAAYSGGPDFSGSAGPTRPPAAGWYADPTGSASVRWWDGTAWTVHTG